MINPNRDVSEEVLQQYKQESYERFRVQFATAVEQKLLDFEMSWDDLATRLKYFNGTTVKGVVRNGHISAEKINAIAHVFSCEPYIILRPRNPWVAT